MVILHVLKSNAISGMENVAISIIRAMPDNIRSVYLTATGSIETTLLNYDIEYIGVNKVDEKSIKSTIDEVKPDIIHAYEYECSLMCAKVTDDIPIISHIYSSPKWVQKIGPKSVSYGGACKNFTRIIIPDRVMIETAWFKDKMAGKECIMGMPFDAPAVFEKGYLAGTEMTKDKLEKYHSDLLFVGKLTDDKNPLEFIKIVGEIKKKKNDIRAIMVGGGDLGKECIARINKFGLGDNVSMVGFQYNPYVYMNQTRLLLVPSKFEGFCMVAAEAMTFGKPVLASYTGGLVVNVDEECGKLCGNPKQVVDRQDFISTTLMLLDDEEEYHKRSEGARKRAKTLNTHDDYMKDMIAIYEDIYETTRQT